MNNLRSGGGAVHTEYNCPIRTRVLLPAKETVGILADMGRLGHGHIVILFPFRESSSLGKESDHS